MVLKKVNDLIFDSVFFKMEVFRRSYVSKRDFQEDSKTADEFQDVSTMDKSEKNNEKRISRIQTNFIKLFDCPVCFERITPPVTVCVNGHAVCQSCKKQLNSCPTCKASFSTNKNTMLNQIIEENIFACKYSEKGCWVEMKFRDLEQHEQKTCKFRTVVCSIPKDVNSDAICDEKIPICQYYNHVDHNHLADYDYIQFNIENHYILDVSSAATKVNIFKDLNSGRIIFEKIKLDKTREKFYITYEYVGNSEEANRYAYELRIYNAKEKHKELRFKTLCLPIGLTGDEIEESERCLVLNMNILKNFRSDDRLFYSMKIEPVSQKWYEIVKEKWKGFCSKRSRLPPEARSQT